MRIFHGIPCESLDFPRVAVYVIFVGLTVTRDVKVIFETPGVGAPGVSSFYLSVIAT